jgi:hypothetical protein
MQAGENGVKSHWDTRRNLRGEQRKPGEKEQIEKRTHERHDLKTSKKTNRSGGEIKSVLRTLGWQQGANRTQHEHKRRNHKGIKR